MAIKILLTANERLIEIWEYTDSKWDEEQADKYIQGLLSSAEDIQHQRFRWHSVEGSKFQGVTSSDTGITLFFSESYPPEIWPS